MINGSAALVRKLREFFDRELGVSIWDQGAASAPYDPDGDAERVVYRGEAQGRRFEISVIADEDAPFARMNFKMGSREIAGHFDDATFALIKPHLMGDLHAADR